MFKVHYIYATMNSGKTTRLLQNMFSYQQAGVKTYLLTPKIDTRNGVGTVESRIGLKAKADLVLGDTFTDELAKLIDKAYIKDNIIMIDEAQFLKPELIYKIVEYCRDLDYAMPHDDEYFTLYAYGLLTDFTGHLFDGSKAWVEEADSMRKEDTKCFYCNRKATKNLLTSHNTDSNIQIGDSEYQPVCSYHYWYYTHTNRL